MNRPSLPAWTGWFSRPSSRGCSRQYFDPHFIGSVLRVPPWPVRPSGGQGDRRRRCIEDGLEWVADIDLDRFFDRVQFDVLMAGGWRQGRRTARSSGFIRCLPEKRGVEMIDGVKQATVDRDAAGLPAHAPNAMGNFCFDITLSYRRLERPRRVPGGK